MIAGLAMVGISSISRTAPDQFAIQETLYKFNSEIIKPRISAQVPFVQFTHNFQSSTQRAEFNAGSCRFWPMCANTQDHNSLIAQVVLNYKVKPDAQNLSYHLWEMDGFVMPDGYWLATRVLNESTNAVMGRNDMATIMKYPEQLLKQIKDDFVFRLEQNNIPIEVESLELKKVSTSFWPANRVYYAVVKGP